MFLAAEAGGGIAAYSDMLSIEIAYWYHEAVKLWKLKNPATEA